jgi:hypothetical protein
MSYAEAAEFDAWRRAKVPSAPMEPHPDAAQLISIADLIPTLSGADPAMLANVGHYLRGLSDRVKVLPVARTGPLRVAAEAVSAPVGAVAQMTDVQQISMALQPFGLSILKTTTGYKVEKLGLIAAHIAPVPRDMAGMLRADLSATTPPQAEPSIEQQLQNARKDFTAMKALTESGAAEIARLTAELAQANAMCESLAASVQDLANAKAAVDEAHAVELADEKAVVDVLRSELQDRLQKQRAAEAELQEATQWVDVNERKPEKFEEVLIAFAGQFSIAATGQYTASPHDHGGWCYPAENHGANDAGEGWPTVTHWQRLPVVPEAPKP